MLIDFVGGILVASEGSNYFQAAALAGTERHYCEVRCLPPKPDLELGSFPEHHPEVVVSFPYSHIADVWQQYAVVAAEASQFVAEEQVVPLQGPLTLFRMRVNE